jgi:hypothetical protein
VNEAFARHDDMQQAHEQHEVPLEGHNLEEIIDTTNPKNSRNFDVLMERFISKASTPLFERSSTFVLLAILLLLNLKIVHSMSNAFMDELFSFLQK